MSKAGRIQSRAERSTERFVAPAKRAERILFAEAAANESGPLSSGVRLWAEAPIVYRLDGSLLDALIGSDLKVTPPRDALMHLPFGCFCVAFDAPVEVWDGDDELTRVFEGFIVTGVIAPKPTSFGKTLFYAVPVSDPEAVIIRGTFYGTIKETGRSQVTTASIPGIHGSTDSQLTLEQLIDDEPFRGADVHTFDARGQQTTVSGHEFLASGTFAQGSLRAPLIHLMWQVLLYLASPEPDVREAEPPEGAERTSFRKFVTVGKTFELGWQVGAALRDAYARSGEGVEGHGFQTRPHVRRGHWHTYLYGRRERKVYSCRLFGQPPPGATRRE